MIDRCACRPFLGLIVGLGLVAAACGSTREAAPEPKTANVAASGSSSATPASSSSLDALPPPDTDTSGQSRRALTVTESRGTVDPGANAIPFPAKIDTPPQAGVEAAIKAVPSAVPIGNMSKSILEAPLRDAARFEHCRIPYGTHGEIAAIVYNGAALGVDVKTKPHDRALNFCMERAVRQMTWVKELAVNKVKVTF